jgi:hypothetical protein
MYQHRRAQSRASIRRARREKAEFLVIRIGNALAQLGVERFHHRECAGDMESRLQRLEAKMILLVHHDAGAASEIDRSATPHRPLRVEARELPAHQMPLMKQQPVLGGKLVHS